MGCRSAEQARLLLIWTLSSSQLTAYCLVLVDVAFHAHRMRSASVLVVNMRGLATEVCKNIVLAGIGQLTILDDADVTEEDLGCGFFLREADVGQKVSVQCFVHTIE